jgi:hypothetical protein
VEENEDTISLHLSTTCSRQWKKLSGGRSEDFGITDAKKSTKQ